MRNFVFATEGAHDVSFVGKLLTRRGFTKVTKFDDLPMDWKPLFPTKFPWNGNNIERVARFPEVFTNGEAVVGLLNSGGDSRLIEVLRNALDILVPSNVERAVIFSDADCAPASERFSSLVSAMVTLNEQATLEKAPGYPIPIPTRLASLEGCAPEIAIFVFPDNNVAGTLEDILFECAALSHPELAEKAQGFIDDLDGFLSGDHASLRKMRLGSNKKKSVMGSVANVLKPGSSLAVAVEQQKLIPEAVEYPALVKNFDEFIGDCLE